MTKLEFTQELKKRLAGIPAQDLEERLAFCTEMIDDRIEEGLSEEEAVAAAGSIDEIVAQILSDYPLSKIVKEKVRPKHKFTSLEIALLILSSPLWLPLLGTVFSTALTVAAVLLMLFIGIWATDAAILGCAIIGIVCAVIFFIRGATLTGVFSIGATLACAGLAILLFFACRALSKLLLSLCRKLVFKIKASIAGRREKK